MILFKCLHLNIVDRMILSSMLLGMSNRTMQKRNFLGRIQRFFFSSPGRCEENKYTSATKSNSMDSKTVLAGRKKHLNIFYFSNSSICQKKKRRFIDVGFVTLHFFFVLTGNKSRYEQRCGNMDSRKRKQIIPSKPIKYG